MERRRLDQWLTILANAAVLGGLVFVGLELRQNTAQLRSNASYSLTASVNQMNAGVYGDPSLADLLLRGEQDLGSLDAIERSRFELYQFARLNVAEYMLDVEKEGVSGLNFRYVDFIASQYRSKPGLQEFAESIEATWAGSDELLAMMLGRPSRPGAQ